MGGAFVLWCLPRASTGVVNRRDGAMYFLLVFARVFLCLKHQWLYRVCSAAHIATLVRTGAAICSPQIASALSGLSSTRSWTCCLGWPKQRGSAPVDGRVPATAILLEKK